MSTTDALGDLTKLASAARASSSFEEARRKAVNGFSEEMEIRPLNKRAIDLLGAVLALSSRTRRIVQPRVDIDIDVFTPMGQRAVSLRLGRLS